MPETYKVEEWTSNDPVMWTVATALGALGGYEKYQAALDKTPGEITVGFQINGVEVSFKDVVKELMSVYDKNVQATARQLIEDKAYVLREKLYKLERISEEIETHFMNEFLKLVPECLTQEDFR